MNGNPAPVSLTASSLKMVAALFFLLGLLYLFSYLLRRFSPHGSPLLGRNMIKLHSRYPLGERKSLCLVQVKDEFLLLGLGRESVTLLTKVEMNEEERRRYMQLGSGAWVRPFLDRANTVRARPSPPGPTSVVSLTLTAKQRSTWLFRGGGKWLRALLKEHA